ncbi:Ankyrin repeat protein [Alternaria alternata]|nr:Ankyrin repeat protein [Alternaria alternata]
METLQPRPLVVLRKTASSTSLASKEDTTDSARFSRKFGKHIQKRQLEIPEYAASFVDYKALKKLIKKLSATPVIPPQSEGFHHESLDPQSSLQANKATFFFRVVRLCARDKYIDSYLINRNVSSKRSTRSTCRKRQRYVLALVRRRMSAHYSCSCVCA